MIDESAPKTSIDQMTGWIKSLPPERQLRGITIYAVFLTFFLANSGNEDYRSISNILMHRHFDT